jgi:hypothetical protein
MEGDETEEAKRGARSLAFAPLCSPSLFPDDDKDDDEPLSFCAKSSLYRAFFDRSFH